MLFSLIDQGGKVSDQVFVYDNGQPLPGDRVGPVTSAAMAKAGIVTDAEGRACFASLRTTAASVLADQPEALIGALLGHSRKASMTLRYVRTTISSLAPLVEILDAWIGCGDTRGHAGHRRRFEIAVNA